jgi:hypothetical protein
MPVDQLVSLEDLATEVPHYFEKMLGMIKKGRQG